MKSSIVTLRCLVLLAFLVGMPLLAMPPVADSVSSMMQTLLSPNGPHFHLADAGEVAPEPTENQAEPESPLPQLSIPTRAVAQTSLTEEPAARQTLAERDATLNQRMKEVSRRLEYWGSTDYALERVSADEPKFRFACRVPLEANSPYSRPFEEVDSDPYVAMNRVLARIEGWRTAQAETNASYR